MAKLFSTTVWSPAWWYPAPRPHTAGCCGAVGCLTTAGKGVAMTIGATETIGVGVEPLIPPSADNGVGGGWMTRGADGVISARTPPGPWGSAVSSQASATSAATEIEASGFTTPLYGAVYYSTVKLAAY